MEQTTTSSLPLRILLIGSGGREHTLAWKLSQSPRVEMILAVPGNGGTATCPKTRNCSEVAESDLPGLVDLARRHNINFVVPGPEASLVQGAVDAFQAAGILSFGPDAAAARLEGSKTFAKDFMHRHQIPTAAYASFSNHAAASEYVAAQGATPRIVIKATGLAAGKGVLLPTTQAEAQEGLRTIMVERQFGAAGDEVVIEECLEGDELSVLTFSDGHSFVSLPPAQDHKRIFDGDQGPNTGGMGCYAPTNLATPELRARIDSEVVAPTIAGIRAEKMPFRGCLFTGLMITAEGPKVLEYNVRFGDPESQTLLPLLDADLASIMLDCARGCLNPADVKVFNKFSATVVVASGGYPGAYAKNIPITIQPAPVDTTLFHAGTKLCDDGKLLVNGGRVVAVNAIAPGGLDVAVKQAYEGVKLVQFDKSYHRKDIAHRAFRTDNNVTTTKQSPEGLTYAAAGVNIDVGNNFVEQIRAAVASTARPGADAEIGGFGGEFDLERAGYSGGPIIVAAIDGVGTKLKIAGAMGQHHGVGIDLVAMNVNDLIVQGAEPIMFLDYIGCGRLDPSVAAEFVQGVATACRDAGCALVGGETAEMPGMYQNGDYDAAGCAIGVMRPERRLPRTQDMVEGDALLGLASSGVHSNGFSLVRRIVATQMDAGLMTWETKAPWVVGGDEDVGTSLLTPTRIYVRSLLKLLGSPLGVHVKGLAHITGGGLIDNVPRMLPRQLAAEIDVKTWPLPPIFQWLKQTGNVASTEMARTFNSGIGMVVVVAGNEETVEKVKAELEALGETVYRIGKLVPRSGKTEPCNLVNLDAWK